MLERIKDFFLNIRDAAFVALLYLFLMIVIILAVIVIVLWYFLNAMPPLPVAHPLNTTMSQITTLAAAGTNLFTVSLIIIAAAGVIAAVGLIYMGRRGGGME